MNSTKIERLRELQTKFAGKSGLAYCSATENIDVLLDGNIHDVINWHYNQSWFQRYSHHYPRPPLTPEEWEIENARWLGGMEKSLLDSLMLINCIGVVQKSMHSERKNVVTVSIMQ